MAQRLEANPPLRSQRRVRLEHGQDARHELELPDTSQRGEAGPRRDVDAVRAHELLLQARAVVEAQGPDGHRHEVPLPRAHAHTVEVADHGPARRGDDIAQERVPVHDAGRDQRLDVRERS